VCEGSRSETYLDEVSRTPVPKRHVSALALSEPDFHDKTLVKPAVFVTSGISGYSTASGY